MADRQIRSRSLVRMSPAVEVRFCLWTPRRCRSGAESVMRRLVTLAALRRPAFSSRIACRRPSPAVFLSLF